MDHYRRHGGVAGPLILVAIGLALLLSNLGLLTWSAWDLLQLWPLLLMAVGIDLLVGRRTTAGAILAAVLITALLAGGLWLASSGYRAPGEPVGQTVEQPLQDMSKADVSLKPAVGDLSLSALDSTSKDLLTGGVHAYQQGTVTSHFSLVGGTPTYVLEAQGAGVIFPTFGRGPTWDLRLNPGLPISLTVEQGAGQMTLDFRGLQISNLKVNLGMGQITVTLPAKGQYHAQIEGAIGDTTVILPEGLEAKIELNAALAARSVPAGFSHEGNLYVSSGYEAAADRVDLVIGEAIGNVSIER